jgi:hypothetical protein
MNIKHFVLSSVLALAACGGPTVEGKWTSADLPGESGTTQNYHYEFTGSSYKLTSKTLAGAALFLTVDIAGTFKFEKEEDHDHIVTNATSVKASGPQVGELAVTEGDCAPAGAPASTTCPGFSFNLPVSATATVPVCVCKAGKFAYSVTDTKLELTAEGATAALVLTKDKE